MKSIKKIILLLLFLSTTFMFSQERTQKQLEREQNKFDIFTPEENAELQYFYDAIINKMKLSEEEEELYYTILTFYTFDMARLDDKDKDFTKEEIRIKFNDLVNKMNTKIKVSFTVEQYIIHLEGFSEVIRLVSQRNNWNKD